MEAERKKHAVSNCHRRLLRSWNFWKYFVETFVASRMIKKDEKDSRKKRQTEWENNKISCFIVVLLKDAPYVAYTKTFHDFSPDNLISHVELLNKRGEEPKKRKESEKNSREFFLEKPFLLFYMLLSFFALIFVAFASRRRQSYTTMLYSIKHKRLDGC